MCGHENKTRHQESVVTTIDRYNEAFAKAFPSSDIEREWDIAQAIYDAHAQGLIPEQRIKLRGSSDSVRTYLGASGLMHECARSVFYAFRKVTLPSFPGRILRLFRTGDIEEERVRHELKAIGFEVGGDQSQMRAFGGLVKGHTDGFVRLPGLPWLLFEAKSCNRKRFKELERFYRDGVEAAHPLQAWKSHYWGQIHIYMQAFGLDGCLYAVVNKDTDEVRVDLIEYDAVEARAARDRALECLGHEPPARPFKKPRTPTCTYCDQYAPCWEAQTFEPPVRCGTCEHFDVLISEGVTRCGLTGGDTTQVDTCEDWEAATWLANDTTQEFIFS